RFCGAQALERHRRECRRARARARALRLARLAPGRVEHGDAGIAQALEHRRGRVRRAGGRVRSRGARWTEPSLSRVGDTDLFRERSDAPLAAREAGSISARRAGRALGFLLPSFARALARRGLLRCGLALRARGRAIATLERAPEVPTRNRGVRAPL